MSTSSLPVSSPSLRLFITSLLYSLPLFLLTPSVFAQLSDGKLKWSAEIEVKSQLQRKRQDNLPRQGPEGEVSLGLTGSVLEKMQGELELRLGKSQEQAQAEVHKAFFTLTGTEQVAGWQARLGQFPLPLGIINENDKTFISTPLFFTTFFGSEPLVDAGLFLNYNWGQLSLGAGVFTGQKVWSQEAESVPPSVPPHLLQLSWKDQYWQTGLTLFSRQPYRQDRQDLAGWHGQWTLPVRAWDIGGSMELWLERLDQRFGPDQDSIGGYTHLFLRRRAFEFGLRWGFLRNLDLRNIQNQRVKDRRWELAPRFQWVVAPALSLDAEYWHQNLSQNFDSEEQDYGFMIRALITLE